MNLDRPTVSICLPNLNYVSFLPERLRTIFDQSFEDWELVVVDSYSSDGAWEYLVDQAKLEPRMRIYQAPREGIYPGLNRSLRMARGKYVYIATSDDIMPTDCLAKLVRALQEHPECNLAHCPLRLLNAEGHDIPNAWSKDSIFARSSGAYLEIPHVRIAPFDGLLHLAGESVYISLTQLLIRRSLFDVIGMFESDWGPMGDFHWNMRATLVSNTVHVPDTWGGWRVHPLQATNQTGLPTYAYWNKTEQMINHAVKVTLPLLQKSLGELLLRDSCKWLRQRRHCTVQLAECSTRSEKLSTLMKRILYGDSAAWSFFWWRLAGMGMWKYEDLKIIQLWAKSLQMGEPIRRISEQN